MDFISFHIKGEGHSNLIVQDELQMLSKIKALYPAFMRKPFYNDEGDPLVGWSKGENWRADARYPAIVVKVNLLQSSMLVLQLCFCFIFLMLFFTLLIK